jgi:methylthioribose-1-phosphate isomerase
MQKLTTIRLTDGNPQMLEVIDQRFLPHQLIWHPLNDFRQTDTAIKEMIVRGAPLIGVTAAYGCYLASLEFNGDRVKILEAASILRESRPTAINLMWAIDKVVEVVNSTSEVEMTLALLNLANDIKNQDIETCFKIGQHGLPLIEEIYNRKQSTVNILTHCNAGWLGCVDWGTATSPIYQAHLKGIPVHVWVDETRPRNQGFNLTAWELTQRGVPHTLVVDNTGGHLMQHGLVDICFVGTDRTTIKGDVANKIGKPLTGVNTKSREVEKSKKYQEVCCSMDQSFLPVVFKSQGLAGGRFLKHFDKLIAHRAEEIGAATAPLKIY